jgi:methyl-accepting chemotaxis protein
LPVTNRKGVNVNWLWSPVVWLLGRLRYPHKLLLVILVLLVPLGFVATAYIELQRGQVAFSAKERVGVAYLVPVLDLTASAVAARHLATTGGDPSGTGLADVIGRADQAAARFGGELNITATWEQAKELLVRAGSTSAPRAAFDAYNAAIDKLLTLIVETSDASNLTLDPDLDTYYLMDALVFRLPILLDTSSRAVDQAALMAGATDRAHNGQARVDLAIAVGSLATTRQAVDAGLATSFAETHSTTLRSRAAGGVQAVDAAIGQVIERATAAARTGELARLNRGQADAARQATAALVPVLASELDQLLQVRIGGFNAKALRVELTVGVAVLVVAWLMVGSYRSAKRPLQRTLVTLEALAQGDLTRAVPVDTRDEVGQMATALNHVILRMREAIGAIGSSTSSLADSSRGCPHSPGTCTPPPRPPAPRLRWQPARPSRSRPTLAPSPREPRR